jgi:hypothetical protein
MKISDGSALVAQDSTNSEKVEASICENLLKVGSCVFTPFWLRTSIVNFNQILRRGSKEGLSGNALSNSNSIAP